MRYNLKAVTLSVGLVVVALLIGSTSLFAAYAAGSAKPDPQPKCKISPLQAIQAATQKVPGRALNANFELDEGKWIYGVIVVSGKSLSEVQVDPMTGKAGDVEKVTPDDEAQEMKVELTKAIGGKVKNTKEKDEEDEKDEKPEKP